MSRNLPRACSEPVYTLVPCFSTCFAFAFLIPYYISLCLLLLDLFLFFLLCQSILSFVPCYLEASIKNDVDVKFLMRRGYITKVSRQKSFLKKLSGNTCACMHARTYIRTCASVTCRRKISSSRRGRGKKTRRAQSEKGQARAKPVGRRVDNSFAADIDLVP